MYPEYLVAPMRKELTDAGFEDLKTADEVDSTIKNNDSVLVVINSVCGCAASNARPAARTAVENAKRPSKIVTVFAGVEKEAVEKARSFMAPYPPSSPAMALFKGGKLVHMIERHNIEGKPAQMIADNLVAAFEEFC